MITISEHDHELYYYQSGRVFSISIIMDHQILCYIIIDIYDMINMACYRRIAIRELATELLLAGAIQSLNCPESGFNFNEQKNHFQDRY